MALNIVMMVFCPKVERTFFERLKTNDSFSSSRNCENPFDIDKLLHMVQRSREFNAARDNAIRDGARIPSAQQAPPTDNRVQPATASSGSVTTEGNAHASWMTPSNDASHWSSVGSVSNVFGTNLTGHEKLPMTCAPAEAPTTQAENKSTTSTCEINSSTDVASPEIATDDEVGSDEVVRKSMLAAASTKIWVARIPFEETANQQGSNQLHLPAASNQVGFLPRFQNYQGQEGPTPGIGSVTAPVPQDRIIYNPDPFSPYHKGLITSRVSKIGPKKEVRTDRVTDSSNKGAAPFILANQMVPQLGSQNAHQTNQIANQQNTQQGDLAAPKEQVAAANQAIQQTYQSQAAQKQMQQAGQVSPQPVNQLAYQVGQGSPKRLQDQPMGQSPPKPAGHQIGDHVVPMASKAIPAPPKRPPKPNQTAPQQASKNSNQVSQILPNRVNPIQTGQIPVHTGESSLNQAGLNCFYDKQNRSYKTAQPANGYGQMAPKPSGPDAQASAPQAGNVAPEQKKLGDHPGLVPPHQVNPLRQHSSQISPKQYQPSQMEEQQQVAPRLPPNPVLMPYSLAQRPLLKDADQQPSNREKTPTQMKAAHKLGSVKSPPTSMKSSRRQKVFNSSIFSLLDKPLFSRGDDHSKKKKHFKLESVRPSILGGPNFNLI